MDWDLGTEQNGTYPGGNEGTVNVYWRLEQALANGSHRSPFTIDAEPSRTVYFTKQNGDTDSGSKEGWGSGGGSPFVWKNAAGNAFGPDNPTHPAFNGIGYQVQIDMANKMYGWASSINNSNAWKLLSVLGWGDILTFYGHGTLRTSCLPNHQNSAGDTDEANARPSNQSGGNNKGTTFKLSQDASASTNETDLQIKYLINVPFKYSIGLHAIAPEGGATSNKPNWSSTFESSSYGGSPNDGGLIILEPVADDAEDQNVKIKFRNLSVGSLKLLSKNFEAKLVDSVTASSTWDSVGGGEELNWTNDYWDVAPTSGGKIRGEYGYYIYQPTSTPAVWLDLDETVVSKETDDDWINKWVVFKFDLDIWNAIKYVNTGGCEYNQDSFPPDGAGIISSVTNLAVAYQIQSSTAAASMRTVVAT
jgi:hypothetical protein